MGRLRRYLHTQNKKQLYSLALTSTGAALLIVGALLLANNSSFIPLNIRLVIQHILHKDTKSSLGLVAAWGNISQNNYDYGNCYDYSMTGAGTVAIGGADIVRTAGNLSSPSYATQIYASVYTAGNTLILKGEQATIEWSCNSSVTRDYWHACNGWGTCNCIDNGVDAIWPTNGVTVSGPGVSFSTTTLTGQYTFTPATAGTNTYNVLCQNTWTSQLNMPVPLYVSPGTLAITASTSTIFGTVATVSWAASQEFATSSCSLTGPINPPTPNYIAPSYYEQVGTLPKGLAGASTVTIGATTYLFGGVTTSGGADSFSNTIYSASASNPATWSAIGTLPVALAYSSLLSYNGNIYLLGGLTASGATKAIYTASTGSPQSWSTAAQTLVDPLYGSSVLIQGTTAYLFGGQTTGGATVRSIYTSTLPPTTWTKSASQLPAALGNAQNAVINGVIYLFGGTP